MPHVMTPGVARPASGTDGRLGFGVPGYAHPLLAPLEWAELARPGMSLHWAVLNVAQGPGARPDPYCREAVDRLRAAGRRVLGSLELRRGCRPFGELVSDAHRFLDWYGVDGFYLARCPCEPAYLRETRRTATTLRALCGGGLLVFGHGRHPYPGYAECADQLVTFAGGWPDYRWSQAAEWTAELPPERFCHLVHGVSRTHLDEALRIARWQGAGTVWFTDRTAVGGANPWEGLPGYWDEIVSRLGPGVSE
ncbi:phage tail protein [Streptomyces armeniacus]|uniref:Phage tail protein n=1 Tax=Streptomyces armeniacus TaxID=83291 RepID=A0A345XIT7_9ACTN|nr:spherulation-specific family 4 protein [Streptomyces armeniacus]AXK31553.1 phage tail protein [Streptomyces armeniacus]